MTRSAPSTSNLRETARDLLACYRERVRPFFEEHKVAFVEAIDRTADLVEVSTRRKRDVSVGFLGAAQVGKSTLINALVEQTALPAGGIGPLTAQATRVMFAPEGAFEVGYHSRQRLNQLTFGIITHLQRKGVVPATLKLSAEELGAEPASADNDVLVRDLLRDVADAAEPDDETAASRSDAKVLYMLDQARKMLCDANDGASGADDRVIVDGLRSMLGQRRIFPELDLTPFEQRIAAIRTHLGTTERVTESEAGGRRQFREALNTRAAGWLAPLVERLTVYLGSELVRNMTLVDLPGIGVFADAAGHVAEEFVRKEGDALVIVVHNAGIGENLVELLEDTGVITKLLFGGSDDVPPIHVAFAITHLDDVAKERYKRAAEDAAEFDEQPPDRHELFSRLAKEMEGVLRRQIREALRRSPAFDDLPDDKRARRETVIDRLCESMDVICVAAPDYMSIIRSMEDTCFLKKTEATGVPAFRAALSGLAEKAQSRWDEGVRSATAELQTAALSQLRAIGSAYESGGGTATVEWEEFTRALREHALSLTSTMQTHHGEALARLKSELPTKIDVLCRDAENAAIKRLRKLSHSGGSLPWASLNAALKRKGKWERKNIDYPGVLTTVLVDSVASDWEPMVVAGVRSTVDDLARRDLRLVEDLCAFAEKHDKRIVGEAHIEAQKELLRKSARSCVKWTNERLDELRAEVRTEIFEVVLRELARACDKAITDRANYGRGARDHILHRFETGGEAAIAVSRRKVEEILKRKYDQLRQELAQGYLSEHHDPIKAALEALTQEELARARRSDAQRRRRVMERVGQLETELADFAPGQA